MNHPTFDQYISFAKVNAGKTFYTIAKKRPFSVVVKETRLAFILENTKPRYESLSWVKKFLKKYEQSNSSKGADYYYKDGTHTRNASYLIALAKAYEKQFLTRGSNRWTREQILVALNLYFRTPFGKQDKGNPEIIQLAIKLGRTPSALAMKLSNFTSLDPLEAARGIAGLSGASQLDKTIWKEFQENRIELAIQSEELLQNLLPNAKTEPNSPQTDRETWTKTRTAQNYFRRVILTCYNNQCCVTGNPIPELLRASHIMPWAKSKEHRLDPTNGLCLSATYDAAFDRGLISFDENYKLLLSKKIAEHLPNKEIEDTFLKREGMLMRFPVKNFPNSELLGWHRNQIFISC